MPRLIRMHSNEMEDVPQIKSGEICGIFGVECSSGDTFCSASDKEFAPTMMSMHVPEPVVSLAIHPKDGISKFSQFSKALSRFQREDPTFRVSQDAESKETIISGMGELQLQVYTERMKREYGCEVVAGNPKVNFRETINKKQSFEYLHKKQTGGSGQYAKIIGWIEPVTKEELEEHQQSTNQKTSINYIFENQIVDNALDPNYIVAVQKGLADAINQGPLTGHPVLGLKFVLTGGQMHPVDSSEMAFKTATKFGFRKAFLDADPSIMEPVMSVEVQGPAEYNQAMLSLLNQRKGIVENTVVNDGYCTHFAAVPLKDMFGFSSAIRSVTQAKGEYSMEFREHAAMSQFSMSQVLAEYEKDSTNKKK